MIGLQDLIINQNRRVTDIAKEINISPTCIYDWFNKNKIPDNQLKILSHIFNVEEGYLNKIVNDINTYRPKAKGFNDYEIIGDTTYIFIETRKGEIFKTLIDTEDLERLIKLNYRWTLTWNYETRGHYARTSYRYKDEYGNKKYVHILLHRYIMNIQNDDFVDHIAPSSSLNNKKNNLRITTNDKNTKNRSGKNSNNKSGFRNVFWSNRDNRWLVQIQVNGKNTCLGRFKFEDLDKAGKLAEEMRQKYYGEFAGHN